MTNQERIEEIENKWMDLMDIRIAALEEASTKVLPQQRLALIEQHNNNPYWEKQFDAMEEELRQLDKSHSFLRENQIEIA